jgi:hypothetical protein
MVREKPPKDKAEGSADESKPLNFLQGMRTAL